MRPRTIAATLMMTAALSGLPPSRMSAAEQQPPPATRQVQPQTPSTAARQETVFVERDRTDAPTTREHLRELLTQEYPPSLGQVLRLDPTLLNSPAYLAPYPRLAAYLAQHPEIARNPSYFLGTATTFPDSRRQTIEAIEETLAGLAFFLFFMTALTVLTHIARSVLEHRRWMQATKIQTEAHTKLVDRLASNEELMAYVQSAAGQRFLTSAPTAIDPDTRIGGSYPVPYSRILNATQIGIVAACGGIGLWLAKERVIEEVAQLLHVISILGIALGVGFVLSGLMSYGLSRQLGLLKPSTNA
jgi:hypothetical protein